MDFLLANYVLESAVEDLLVGELQEASNKLSEVVRIPTKDASMTTRSTAAQVVKGTRKAASKSGKNQWVANHMLSKLYTQSGAPKKGAAAYKKAHKDTIDAEESRDTLRSMKSAVPHTDPVKAPVGKPKSKPSGVPSLAANHDDDGHAKIMAWHRKMFDKYSSKPANESDDVISMKSVAQKPGLKPYKAAAKPTKILVKARAGKADKKPSQTFSMQSLLRSKTEAAREKLRFFKKSGK